MSTFRPLLLTIAFVRSIGAAVVARVHVWADAEFATLRRGNHVSDRLEAIRIRIGE
ncbi:hypothetical protein [Sinorhizobium sp. BJ1]|uniref:hypothetical protein n=1 Tax=Sinorhizobium sp. BJ1 TaxID=2035455 RepID=UPI0015CF01D5|nr:hypothetical protein [Sinorhizobium sp. BJ1]